ncbi:tail fiber assembly protein [Erwinia sp. 198]|uniref:tail fiber assembly protein n=1 Tax=Erwinia sp. 198 TaxID=2022746 RepID=UPI000F692C50|nr:tail fiber assembly protein [Erwinia sp. 198]RRZ90938.1 tail fiber assembly protein [Erwinia sp. 198]
MNNYFYSKKTNGFYPEIMKADYESSPDGWPDDAVVVSEESYNKLYEGQAHGKIITADNDGNPILIDPPGPTTGQLIALAEEQRGNLLAEATIAIAPLQDAVELDEATDEEKVQLAAWKKYRILLNRLNVNTAPDIIWPEKP